jgi:hypothetical protein
MASCIQLFISNVLGPSTALFKFPTTKFLDLLVFWTTLRLQFHSKATHDLLRRYVVVSCWGIGQLAGTPSPSTLVM